MEDVVSARGEAGVAVDYRSGHIASMPDYHAHNHAELFYCLSDDVVCLVGERVYKLRRFDVVLLGPGVFHRTVIPEGVVYERYTVSFRPQEFARFLPECVHLLSLFGRGEGHCLVRLAEDPAREAFHEDVARMHEQARAGGPSARGHLMARLASLLLFLCDRPGRASAAGAADEPPFRLVQPALEHIRAHFAERVRLEDLCTALFVSRAQLTRSFRAATGLSVGQYLRELRLMEAKIMLARGASVLDAALDCGFGNISHFIRIFAREVGCTPKQYALRLRRAQDA